MELRRDVLGHSLHLLFVAIVSLRGVADGEGYRQAYPGPYRVRNEVTNGELFVNSLRSGRRCPYRQSGTPSRLREWRTTGHKRVYIIVQYWKRDEKRSEHTYVWRGVASLDSQSVGIFRHLSGIWYLVATWLWVRWFTIEWWDLLVMTISDHFQTTFKVIADVRVLRVGILRPVDLWPTVGATTKKWVNF